MMRHTRLPMFLFILSFVAALPNLGWAQEIPSHFELRNLSPQPFVLRGPAYFAPGEGADLPAHSLIVLEDQSGQFNVVLIVPTHTAPATYHVVSSTASNVVSPFHAFASIFDSDQNEHIVTAGEISVVRVTPQSIMGRVILDAPTYYLAGSFTATRTHLEAILDSRSRIVGRN